MTLTRPAIFVPQCTGVSFLDQICNDNSISDQREPFYASTSPQIYALASCTVIAYLLVVMLFITPRTFFVGGQGGGARFLGGRGIMRGSYGSPSIISVGNRPWLQKFAALSVAASLTIASADTFKIAEQQYNSGFTDSRGLVDQVAASLEIRIVRVISTTFLWLAQVQTLIRLFPRHKEKVVIKWLGFALIVLDTIFTTLNNFVHDGTRTRPRSFQDAIPALSYLFELSISFIYASCVVYYTISKRRFAFFHPKMRNICLVALMSLTAVLIPIVFFVLDISKPNVAGWGDYVRWVGAAAASVVVWEWVERIEALERDERKDGVLGREIFDGDDMLEITSAEELDYARKDNGYPRGKPGSGEGEESGTSSWWADRHRFHLRTRIPFHSNRESSGSQPKGIMARIIPPPPAVTPVSRADTTSAASTVYNVRYHPVIAPSPPVATNNRDFSANLPKEVLVASTGNSAQPSSDKAANRQDSAVHCASSAIQPQLLWRSMPNPFKRRRGSPPAEVAGAQKADVAAPSQRSLSSLGARKTMNVRSRLDKFAGAQHEKLKNRARGHEIRTADLPVTVIPARSHGQRTWSPEDMELGNPVSQATASRSQDDLQANESRTADASQETTERNSSLEGPTVNITAAPLHRSQIGIAQSTLPVTPTTGSTTLFSDDLLRSPQYLFQALPSDGRSDASPSTSAGSSSPRDRPVEVTVRPGPVVSKRGTLTIEEVGQRAPQPQQLTSDSHCIQPTEASNAGTKNARDSERSTPPSSVISAGSGRPEQHGGNTGIANRSRSREDLKAGGGSPLITTRPSFATQQNDSRSDPDSDISPLRSTSSARDVASVVEASSAEPTQGPTARSKTKE